LDGEWQSNREDTVAEAFRRFPEMKKRTPDQIEKFKDIFGHMILRFAGNQVTMEFHDEIGEFTYKVKESGENFVVINTSGAIGDGAETRIEFEEDFDAYWIDTGFDYPEKFDKKEAEPAGTGQPM